MQRAYNQFSIVSKLLRETRRFIHYELETRGKGIIVATVGVLSLSSISPQVSCSFSHVHAYVTKAISEVFSMAHKSHVSGLIAFADKRLKISASMKRGRRLMRFLINYSYSNTI